MTDFLTGVKYLKGLGYKRAAYEGKEYDINALFAKSRWPKNAEAKIFVPTHGGEIRLSNGYVLVRGRK